MSDLTFTVNLAWTGTGKNGDGTAQVAPEISIPYSAPESMGGKGVGTSPEELLIAAVSSCYSGTLFGLLKREGLPVDEVQVRSVGTVSDYPIQAKFSHLCVHPTVRGGSTEREDEYQRIAEVARDRCFIGKTIAGNVDYQVGEVTVVE